MAELDLGKVTKTDSEIQNLILNYNGGVKFGKDSDGNPGYIVTDPETGADTVIPFSSGGGSGINEFESILSAGNYFTNSTTYYISPGNTQTLSKTYKYFLFVVTLVRTNVQYNKVTAIELDKGSGDVVPEQLFSIGNIVGSTLYSDQVYLLNGASSGSKVNIRAKLTMTNSSTNYKYYFAHLIGIN